MNSFDKPENAKRTKAILITPIAQKYKKIGPCSLRDWEEQLLRYKEGRQMMWDDSKLNNSSPGDILAVWHYKRAITFHHITAVYPPSQRLPSWATNVGQTDRNVIYISELFATMDWERWIGIGGHSRCMGTGNVISARSEILAALHDAITTSIDIVQDTPPCLKQTLINTVQVPQSITIRRKKFLCGECNDTVKVHADEDGDFFCATCNYELI